jgi:hypothetical protein
VFELLSTYTNFTAIKSKNKRRNPINPFLKIRTEHIDPKNHDDIQNHHKWTDEILKAELGIS